jgi:heme a synthase
VRASRSGEGCGDRWPLCNGVVIPHAAQIATLIEFTHRATTGIAFVLVVAMAVWAYLRYRHELVWPAAAASLFFLITEALLGAGLVLFNYAGSTVSAGRVVYLSAHLINTMLLVAAIALTAWWGARPGAGIRLAGADAGFCATSMLALLAVAVTGAMTALGDTLFPAASLGAGFATDFSSAAPWLLRLRVVHPLIAVAAGIYVAAVAGRIGRARRPARAVMALVALQIAAGIFNLFLLAPVWMQLVHLLLADLLWIALVIFTAATIEKPSAGSVEDAPGGASFSLQPGLQPRSGRRLKPPLQAKACSTSNPGRPA